jgi:hypothetical protein
LHKVNSLQKDAISKINLLMEEFHKQFPSVEQNKIRDVVFNNENLTEDQVKSAIEFSPLDNKLQLLQEIEAMQFVARNVPRVGKAFHSVPTIARTSRWARDFIS